ncbi:MAG: hypothetical protein M3Y84_14230 [Acidobacteriota bacterium]|nr:hypothetical protein [Acidobacteriota bacterium]
MKFLVFVRVILLVFALGAFGHSSHFIQHVSGALVPQEQQLTQDMFNNFLFYWESLLDLKFTGAEREELKRAVIGYWKTNNTTEIQNTLKQAEGGATDRELGESILSSMREAYQASTVAELRKEPNDPVSVVLVRAFDRLHGFGGATIDQSSADIREGLGSPVVAPGNPPLTQVMLVRFFNFYEFILDLNFSAEQRDRLKKVIIEGWKKNDAQVVDRVVNDLKFTDQKSKDEVTAALGADYQTAIVSDMKRYSGNPLLAQLAEDFDQAHPDKRETTRAKAFTDLVGKWKLGDAMLPGRNPYNREATGISYTDTRTLEITADGQFKRMHVHNHCESGGACCRMNGITEYGAVSIEGGQLVFQVKSGTELNRDGCNTRMNQQVAIKPHRESFNWSIRLNALHNNAQTLCWTDASNESVCLVKQ